METFIHAMAFGFEATWASAGWFIQPDPEDALLAARFTASRERLAATLPPAEHDAILARVILDPPGLHRQARQRFPGLHSAGHILWWVALDALAVRSPAGVVPRVAQRLVEAWRQALSGEPADFEEAEARLPHRLFEALYQLWRAPDAGEVYVRLAQILERLGPARHAMEPFHLGQKLAVLLLLVGRLDEATLAQVWEAGLRSLPTLPWGCADRAAEVEAQLTTLVVERTWKVLNSLDDSEEAHLEGPFVGARWVQAACAAIERLGLGALGKDAASRNLRRVLEEAQLGGEAVDLGRFARATLEVALGAAGAGCRGSFLHALAREQEAQLWQLVRDSGPFDGWFARHDHEAVDQARWRQAEALMEALRAAVEACGEAAARRVLGPLTGGNERRTIVQAMLGWNRDRLEASMKRGSQEAIRAFGLLPVEGGLEEVQARYLRLREVEKAASQWGAQRQANQREAVQEALLYLAGRAGMDTGQLEWTMEARMGGVTPQPAMVGEYTLAIGGDQVVAHRGGRALKNVPAAVKKTPDYETLRAWLSRQTEQRRRFAESLEAAMVEGTALEAAALQVLAGLPAGRPLVEGLVFCADESGPTRFFRGTEALPPRVRVAHPVDIQAAGQLEHWQAHQAQVGWQPPFPQLFRETYVVDEGEGPLEVRRFVGHTFLGAVGVKVLQRRGWRSGSYSEDPMTRRYPKAGLKAAFGFENAEHTFEHTVDGEGNTVPLPIEIGPLRFLDRAGVVLPWRTLPPRIVSEALRDLDLLIHAAGAGERRLSREVLRRRAELAVAVLRDLGVPQVQISGRWLEVAGFKVDVEDGRVRRVAGEVEVELPPAWPGVDGLPLLLGDDGRLRLVCARALRLAQGGEPA